MSVESKPLFSAPGSDRTPEAQARLAKRREERQQKLRGSDRATQAKVQLQTRRHAAATNRRLQQAQLPPRAPGAPSSAAAPALRDLLLKGQRAEFNRALAS